MPRPHLALLLLLSLPACEPAARAPVSTEPPPVILPDSVRELTPRQAEELMANTPGLVLLDVRGDGEAEAEGKIAGAQMYDYLHGEDTVKRLDELDRGRHYLIYCAIGGRAQLTAARMYEMGFNHLSLLKGGLNAWIADGKPIQK